jgi:uncharacterized membrane protein SpoIIM required for sporulation
MKVAQLLESRRGNWQQLEELCRKMEGHRRLPAPVIARFASVYRSVCADLALAESYQLPPSTVEYLHRLVGRAHNQLYRSRRFRIRAWINDLLYTVPGRLYDDRCIRLAAVLFWGPWLLAMWLSSAASPLPDFGEKLVGAEQLQSVEHMYEKAPDDREFLEGTSAAGFYQFHNTTIGLRVFAHGLLFGVGGILETVQNGAFIGAIDGHMQSIPGVSDHFNTFVTAHSPFELTAIILSAGVGMRLGFALLFTGGLTRIDSVRNAGRYAMPAMGVTMILFLLAAFLEGYVSPSALPYDVKAAFAAGSSVILMIYFVLLGARGKRLAQQEIPF